MEEQFFTNHTQHLVYLLFCAFNNKAPDREKMRSMDIDTVCKLAKFHSLQAVCYSALENYAKAFPDERLDVSKEQLDDIKEIRERNVKRNVMFGFEREKLFAFLEREGIWYLPMKGLVLEKYYPVNGWRRLTDNDILFDSEYRSRVKEFMLSEGYRAEEYGKATHDVYMKKPYFNFEMHVLLFGKVMSDERMGRLYEYYKDIKARLIKDHDNNYGYTMRDEDYYVYMIAHAYKHHCYSGTGLRTLVDEYVMLSYFKDSLDREYIDVQLEALGMVEFEKQVREISQKLFSPDAQKGDYAPDLTEEEMQILLYYSSSGTYGTLKNTFDNKLDKIVGKDKEITFWGWIKFCFSRIFPDSNFYKENHPDIYKNKPLLVWFWIKRFFRAVFIKKSATRELMMLKDAKTDRTKK